jgi:subfamily B ATP-binding cassette protein HlyB/CyaB
MSSEVASEAGNDTSAAASASSTSSASVPFFGLQCLCVIAGFHQISAHPIQLARSMGLEGDQADVQDVQRAALLLGLKATPRHLRPDRLGVVPGPVLLVLKDGGFGVVLRRIDEHRFMVVLPPEPGGKNAPRDITLDALKALWAGDVLVVKQPLTLDDQPRRFGFGWFVPVLWKFRGSLSEVLVAALVIQLFALATPLFTQVVIDKVLTHRSISTLNVLVGGMLALIVFDGVLSLLRAWLMSHTTNRLDVMLGARLFSHVIRIPLRFFENRKVGETIARMREIDQIRQFLTGQPLTLAIDALFIFVFLALMLAYSTTLTMVVLLALPCFIAVSLIVRPIFKRRLETLFERNAASQSFVVETVSGMQTVKAMAIEPIFNQRWEKLLARQVHSAAEVQKLSGTASTISNVIQRCTTLAILWVGAHEVMDNHLTLGKLIAFQMVSGQFINPVMRIVSMWQDFQRVALSVDRLGDLMNTPAEAVIHANRALPAQLKGDIVVENVRFRYQADGRAVLHDFSLEARAGTTVGLVGRSGSGKSTLTRLLQRLYSPESGRILIDGLDISQIDPLWLRRQIGVVLQDNVLFSGSIRDNIAIHWPQAPMEAVLQAARLAGAHEFVTDLPEGYDTVVGERGASLSGGQRQRVAIARALLTCPRILIFDEATSALDYESERIIQNNMRAISQGRTVIIIAHRLSTVMHADKIVVLDKGNVMEEGSHADLLARDGLYRHLFSQQSAPPRGTRQAQGQPGDAAAGTAANTSAATTTATPAQAGAQRRVTVAKEQA